MKADPCMAIETTCELYHRILAHGIDESVLLQKTGINLAALKPTENRFSVRNHLKLWRVADELLSHEATGLLMGSESNPNSRGIVGLLFLASRDLESAVYNKVRYTKILADHINLDVNVLSDTFEMNYSILDGFFHRYEIERVFSGFFNWVKIFVDKNIYPVSLSFQYAEPKYIDYYKNYFQCPMYFNQANNSIAFSKELMFYKNSTYNEYLYGILQARAESVLGALQKKSNFISDVLSTIAGRLSQGNFSAECISASHHISLRSFHRKLKEHNVTYQQLLDEVRKDAAISYLNQKDCCDNTIPYMLGYKDRRAFQRAFKRWMGCTPKQHSPD
jgi:AraC-like DNA-binding protein